MARPTKEYRVKINGKSLQLYEKGEYCGSLPLTTLCQMARDKQGNGTE